MANEQCWAKCGGTLRILCHRLLCNPPESVFCCAIHPKATHIATGGEDDRLVVRNMTNFEVVYLEAAFKDSVDQAAFSGKDGAFLAAADMSGVIKVWNVASKEVAWEFETSDIKVGEFCGQRVKTPFETILPPCSPRSGIRLPTSCSPRPSTRSCGCGKSRRERAKFTPVCSGYWRSPDSFKQSHPK